MCRNWALLYRYTSMDVGTPIPLISANVFRRVATTHVFTRCTKWRSFRCSYLRFFFSLNYWYLQIQFPNSMFLWSKKLLKPSQNMCNIYETWKVIIFLYNDRKKTSSLFGSFLFIYIFQLNCCGNVGWTHRGSQQHKKCWWRTIWDMRNSLHHVLFETSLSLIQSRKTNYLYSARA